MPYLGYRAELFVAKKIHRCGSKPCEIPIEPGQQYITIYGRNRKQNLFIKKFHRECFLNWVEWRAHLNDDGAWRKLPRKTKLKEMSLTEEQEKKRASLLVQVSKAKKHIEGIYTAAAEQHGERGREWREDEALCSQLNRQWVNLLVNYLQLYSMGAYRLKLPYAVLASFGLQFDIPNIETGLDSREEVYRKSQRVIKHLEETFREEIQPWLAYTSTESFDQKQSA